MARVAGVMLLLVVMVLALSSPVLAIRPDTDKRILDGLDAAYSMDFERAASLFAEADRLEPEHPAGLFFLASLQWFEYSQNADVPKTANELEPKFNQLIDRALDLSRKMYAKNHDDPEANFYLGAIYGMKGRWLLIQRKWIRAAHYGYKGYKYFKRTIELNPEYYDAYLGLGMYDYYSDTLPTVLKFAANLIARGDKQRGLRYIETTMEKGHYSVTEAKLFLISVLIDYEGQPEKALGLILGLRQEKPQNLFFILMELPARMVALDWNGAIAFGEFLAPRVRETSYTKPHISLFDLYLGEAYLGAKDYAQAVATFSRCIEMAPEPRKATVTHCYLRRAQAYDLLQRRDDAVSDYAYVKGRPDFFDSQDRAALGLKHPYSYEEVLRQLRQ
jgi:tetratricopeptide (TPR) repeat protein